MIDTFPAFQAFWESVQGQPVEMQVDRWASEYMAPWPELFEKQRDSYAHEGLDWRDVARERVFPFIAERLPEMSVARERLLRICPEVARQVRRALGFGEELVAVLYVGVGCGAGWASSFGGRPAVLLGLEMIAECGWKQDATLEGLVAHEVGHLVHTAWRRDTGVAAASGPWWQLYTEGFAEYCGHVILGRETWHECTGINAPDWLDWCRDNTAWLAGEFMRRVDAGESVKPFFGSWYDLRGRKQCGYYLGHEAVRSFVGSAALRDVAVLEDVENFCRAVLRALARGETWPEGQGANTQ